MAAADAVMACCFGVAPSVIAKFRSEMEQPKHWYRDSTGKVWFTEEGKQWIRERLKINDTTPPEVGFEDRRQCTSAAFTVWTEKNAAPEFRITTIVKCHPNTQWVQVRTPDGSLANVRVRNNRALRARLKLQCCLLDDGRWECRQHGQAVKMPRQKKERAAA